MHRALQLARRGFGDTHPNPMVGSVIVSPDGRIIGEGWHRRVGMGHAEVNAGASVRPADAHLLTAATMYVTLEPCSHYGRTPPCARLIIDRRIPHVVIAAGDPFPQVAGRGIAMLREAGCRVDVGLLADDSRRLNAMFITAVERQRPWVTLKWAQSADGFMDHRRTAESPSACRFSDGVSQLAVHRLRHAHDAILVGSETVLADHPRLNNRLWPGGGPRPVVLDRSCRLSDTTLLPPDTLLLAEPDVSSVLSRLYADGVRSVLVEGGAKVLSSFLQSGLWDALRIEESPIVLGPRGTAKAPCPSGTLIADTPSAASHIRWFSNNPLFTASHPMVL